MSEFELKNFVPNVKFTFRELGEFVKRETVEMFGGKRVLLFSLPGAFTPTCSSKQLPGYEENYSKFIENGIDEIYCLSVNDAFVMNAWFDAQGVENVKVLPDGTGQFTRLMGALVDKSNIGFGMRSWRYAMVINDMVVEKSFIEPNQRDNADDDSYVVSDPITVLNYVEGTNS